jgi:hypothetical protein
MPIRSTRHILCYRSFLLTATRVDCLARKHRPKDEQTLIAESRGPDWHGVQAPGLHSQASSPSSTIRSGGGQLSRGAVLGFVGAVQAIAGAQFDRIINTFAGLTAGRV